MSLTDQVIGNCKLIDLHVDQIIANRHGGQGKGKPRNIAKSESAKATDFMGAKSTAPYMNRRQFGRHAREAWAMSEEEIEKEWQWSLKNCPTGVDDMRYKTVSRWKIQELREPE